MTDEEIQHRIDMDLENQFDLEEENRYFDVDKVNQKVYDSKQGGDYEQIT